MRGPPPPPCTFRGQLRLWMLFCCQGHLYFEGGIVPCSDLVVCFLLLRYNFFFFAPVCVPDVPSPLGPVPSSILLLAFFLFFILEIVLPVSNDVFPLTGRPLGVGRFSYPVFCDAPQADTVPPLLNLRPFPLFRILSLLLVMHPLLDPLPHSFFFEFQPLVTLATTTALCCPPGFFASGCMDTLLFSFLSSFLFFPYVFCLDLYHGTNFSPFAPPCDFFDQYILFTYF